MSNDKDKNWEKLRNRAKRAEEELDGWRDVALNATVEQAGFDPDVGVVRMTVDRYRDAHDELDPSDVTPESFREFAEDQGLSPGGGG